MSYLDLEGLTNYDTKIKAYITEKTSGGGGGGSVEGIYIIDFVNLAAEEINSKIEEASTWGSANGGRASVYFKTINNYAKLNAISWKGNCNYYLDYDMGSGTITVSSISNAGFYFSSAQTVTTNALIITDCTYLDFANCKFLNGMASNTITNCNQIYFENCTFKGGTYPNPNTECLVIENTGTTNEYLTFENCIFEYASSSSSPTYVIDGGGITNTKSRVTLINCITPSGETIAAADLNKGSGKWYAITPSAL